MKKSIEKTAEALSRKFASRETSHRGRDSVDNLILTILSQNTNDALRDRAYKALRDRFPTNDEIAVASLSEIEGPIKIAGLSKQKSRTIMRALKAIREEKGEITLDFLKEMPTDEAVSYLKGIKGIGDKTAAIVMLFSFGRNTFPVDTHIQRIVKRMGLVPENYTPPKIRMAIEPHLSDGIAPTLHLNLIALGKEICRPSNPGCNLCPLHTFCQFGKGITGGKT